MGGLVFTLCLLMVTGDTKVTQQALISSFNVDAPMEQVSTYTIEAVWTGTPTIATI